MAWLHYVGGKYTPRKFVEEAKRYGFSRRIPGHMLKKLSWGDSIYFAVWRGNDGIHVVFRSNEEAAKGQRYVKGKAEIFAKGKIEAITFEDPKLWEELKKELRVQGRIISTYSSKPRRVNRACGSYIEGGGIAVDASIEEIWEIAERIAKKLDLGKVRVMIKGPLTKVFDQPKEILAPFTRSLLFYHEAHDMVIDIEPEGEAKTGKIVEIQDYVLAKRKDDFAIPLPLGVR